MNETKDTQEHPIESFLHTSLIPSAWCSGCGIGVVVNTFVQVINKMDIKQENINIVSSGIGCTGKIGQHLNFKSIEVTKGNVMSHAANIAAKKQNQKVVVFLNDTDFIASNVDEFIKAGKKGVKILVIYVNNYIYRIFMEYKALTRTPFFKDVSKEKNVSPFNIPHLAELCGAEYVARWTQLHVRRLMFSIQDALSTDGFSVIEVISPCLMYYVNTENIGESVDRMGIYEESSVIKHNEPTKNLDIRAQQKIIVGKFVWRKKD
jgi:2-oxoglutarate ferredoxin oxidoreductase subunit beta